MTLFHLLIFLKALFRSLSIELRTRASAFTLLPLCAGCACTCGCVTHLATAVKASSTFSPDLALVSMNGTPNSCTQKHRSFFLSARQVRANTQRCRSTSRPFPKNKKAPFLTLLLLLSKKRALFQILDSGGRTINTHNSMVNLMGAANLSKANFLFSLQLCADQSVNGKRPLCVSSFCPPPPSVEVLVAACIQMTSLPSHYSSECNNQEGEVAVCSETTSQKHTKLRTNDSV